MALQPHRRARPRRVPRPRRHEPAAAATPAARQCRQSGVDRDRQRASSTTAAPACLMPRRPVDVGFADELNDVFATDALRRSIWCASPRAPPSTSPIVIVHWIDGDGVAAVPSGRGRRRRRQPSERRGAATRRRTATRAFVAPVVELARRPRRPARLHGRAAARPRTCGRSASQVSTVDADATFTLGRRRLRRRLRPPAHRLPPRRPRRHRQRCSPSTSARATRPSTSARSRTTPPPTRPATCCSRARSVAARAASTPGSSVCGRTPGAPTPSRPTATSSCPTRRGRSRCRTSRSRTTTCAAPTPRPSARSTKTSASTSRAGACRRQVAERLVVTGFFDEVLAQLPDRHRRARVAHGRSPASSIGCTQ